MPKDALARRQIKELEGAVSVLADSNVRMSALMVQCSKAFQILIDKGIITNDEIQAAFAKEKGNDSDTDSDDSDEVQVQSSGSGADESDS